MLLEHRLNRHHDFSGLFGMGARSNSQIYIGFRQFEIDEKGLTHFFIIVLTRMNQPKP